MEHNESTIIAEPCSQGLCYHNDERSATWLELFFDLIFVVAVGKVTHVLAHSHHGHLDAGTWWKFPLMLLPIWWIWMIHTNWANLYDRDSKPQRAMTLVVMLLLIILSTAITTNWTIAYPVFNFSYFAIRLCFVALYWAYRHSHSDYVGFALYRSFGMLVAACISASSFYFPEPERYFVFFVGIGVDMLIPYLQSRFGSCPAVHSEHLIERMGLLIIILMGESVITLSAGLAGVEWTWESGGAALTGAVMIGAAWWIYFDSYHRLALRDGKLQSGLALAYPHFLTCMGLSVIANVIHHAIHLDLARADYQVMAMAGMICFYLGKQIPYWAKYRPLRQYIYTNSALTLALCTASLMLPSLGSILMGLTLALLVYVLLNYFTTIRTLRAAST